MLYRFWYDVLSTMKTNISYVKVTVKPANKCVQTKLSYCEYLLMLVLVHQAHCTNYDIFGIFVVCGFVLFFFYRTWELSLKVMNKFSNSPQGKCSVSLHIENVVKNIPL